MQYDVPLILRFLSKLVLDILPAALASVIGGFLFTQYHSGHNAADKPRLVQVTPASEEMMRLVRDEHAAIVGYLKAQTAAEKTKQASQRDEQVKAIADAAKANAAAFNARQIAEAAPMPRPAPAHSKMLPATRIASAAPAPAPVAAATGRPLELIETPPHVAERPRDPDSLAGKATELKDNVVSATRKVVATIADIPSWIASMGDRSTNSPTLPMTDSSTGRFVSATW
jgi:hypothetical protein